jgi:hypothetical protein
MARGDRTVIEVNPLIEGILALLVDASTGTDLVGKVKEWERPKDGGQKFVSPPYVLVREYPSAGQMSGPLSDTKVDVILRVQILCLGRTPSEARTVRDWTRRFMQRNALEEKLDDMVDDNDRAVMDLSLMVTGGGDTRDDDTPTPFHNSTDLYEVWTTPKTPEEGS